MSYADTFASPSTATPFDSLTRALAQQLNPSDPARANAENLRRLPLVGANDVLQQPGSFPKPGMLNSSWLTWHVFMYFCISLR